MRISSITVRDTFGTALAKFSPASVTRISGPNGSGKSSILRALGRIFEGGHDPSIIRQGAEKSVVEMVLDDGTTIVRTCGPVKRRKGDPADAPVRYRTDLEITDSDGTPIPAPQTFINDLGAASAVDPGSILRIDATTAPGRKALAEVLLQVVKIEFTPDEIREAIMATVPGGAGARTWVSQIDATLNLPTVDATLDLDGLKKFAYQVTEQRRRVGQTRDDSGGAVDRLQKSLPDEQDGEARIEARLAEAEAERRSAEAQKASFITEVKTARAEAVGEATAHKERQSAAINSDFDAQIAELNRRRAEALSQVAADASVTTQQIEREASQALEEAESTYNPQIQQWAAEISRLRELERQQARAGMIRQEIAVQEASHRDASRQYDQLSEVLARLENLRKAKLDSLPVPGLEVSGDAVSIDGIPWQNVNTGRRVEVALQLCTLRSGRLGILLLDDAEHMDSETRKLLEEGIASAGYQLVEAIVSDAGGLTIETFEPAAA